MATSLIASIAALRNQRSRKEKGKQSATPREGLASLSQTNYGGAGQTARIGDVLAEADDAEEDDGYPWNVDQVEEENWNDAEDSLVRDIYSFRKTYRLFAIVPCGCILLFLLLAVLPTLIWPHKSWRPRRDPPRFYEAFLLSAALWSLSYVLRIPLHKACFLALSRFSVLVRRFLPLLHEKLDTAVTIVHTCLFVVVQECLRLSAFVILSLHWHRSDGIIGVTDKHAYTRDAVFHEIWFIGLAWAAAEVGAGIVQGYENLALYDDETLFGPTEPYADNFGNDIQMGSPKPGNEAEERPGSKSSIDRLLYCEPCSSSAEQSVDLDNAITQLTNVKAREDLEVVYGMPFVDVPVFITLLQRVNSYFLSMALTLFLGFAYLPATVPSSSRSLRLWPAFLIAAAAHVGLALLHTPMVLPKIGLPAVAYVACLVSLGLFFVTVGLWIGLWG